jgi:hypothetical protein
MLCLAQGQPSRASSKNASLSIHLLGRRCPRCTLARVNVTGEVGVIVIVRSQCLLAPHVEATIVQGANDVAEDALDGDHVLFHRTLQEPAHILDRDRDSDQVWHPPSLPRSADSI